jgi:multidrug efflux pump subunit AcrB
MKKNKTSPKKQSFKKTNKIYNNHKGQMIILTAILLAIAVFLIAFIPSQMVSSEGVIRRKQATSLQTEFTHMSKVFGKSLQYQLADIKLHNNRYMFIGDIQNIQNAFEDTKNLFYQLYLHQDIYFDASIQNQNWYWFSHTSSAGSTYIAQITILLDNGQTIISEQIDYTLICNTQ